MLVLVTVVVGLLGLAVGSFLNVVIYRVPAGLSVVQPASACPNCGHAIRSRDNVPLLSWLALRAKCRDCGAPISVRYPAVEAATALAFIGVALLFGSTVVMAPTVGDAIAGAAVLCAYLYLTAIGIALALIDIETHRLPNRIVFPSYLVISLLFLVSSIAGGEYSQLLMALVGLAALFSFYFLMVVVYPGGMGFGDVKLAGVLGLSLGWLGFGPLLVGVFAPFLLGGLYAIALMLFGRAGRKSKIPFGPWMIIGAGVGVVGGEEIFNWYLKIVGLA